VAVPFASLYCMVCILKVLCTFKILSFHASRNDKSLSGDQLQPFGAKGIMMEADAASGMLKVFMFSTDAAGCPGRLYHIM